MAYFLAHGQMQAGQWTDILLDAITHLPDPLYIRPIISLTQLDLRTFAVPTDMTFTCGLLKTVTAAAVLWASAGVEPIYVPLVGFMVPNAATLEPGDAYTLSDFPMQLEFSDVLGPITTTLHYGLGSIVGKASAPSRAFGYPLSSDFSTPLVSLAPSLAFGQNGLLPGAVGGLPAPVAAFGPVYNGAPQPTPFTNPVRF